MRKIQLLFVMLAGLLLSNQNVQASGGSVGLTPATGVKIIFGGNNTNTYLPFRFEGEGFLGSNNQHGVGGAFGFDIGTGGRTGYLGYRVRYNVISIAPEYKYYFNGGTQSSPFAGAYTDFRFKGGYNIIGVGAQGGYQHVFDFGLGVYGVGNFGFATRGYSSGGRTNGGEFGVRAGVKYILGK